MMKNGFFVLFLLFFAVIGQAQMAPNDPFLSQQWYIPFSDIKPGQGAGQIPVVIIDTGIAAGHPDLQGIIDPIESKSFLGIIFN